MDNQTKQRTIGTGPACRAVRAGAVVTPLPNGGYVSGGRAYTHTLTTSRGTSYAVSREVMREIDCTRFEMLVERTAKADPGTA